MATDTELKALIKTNIKDKTPADPVEVAEHGVVLDEIVDSKANKSQIPVVPPAQDISGITTNATAITALTTRMDTAETDISGNDTAITALTTRMDTAETDISGNDTDITALNAAKVPAGGAQGQVLKKTSGTDYAMEWANETGGGGGGNPPATYNAPTISRFWITGLNPNGNLQVPASGTTLGGDTVIRYTTTNSANIQGNLELEIDPGTGTYVSQAIDISPTDAGASTTENLDNVTFQGGRTYRYRLSGTNTNGGQFESVITFTVVAIQRDNVYLLASTEAAFPGVTGETALAFTNGVLSTNYPAFNDNSYIYFAQPQADNDINVWNISGANQIGTVQKLAATSDIGGVTYEVWRTNNLLVPSVFSGAAVEIRRPV